MILVGLTGSIGSGKSTAATMLRRLGARVHDADKEVHRLLAHDQAAIAAIAARFPGCVVKGSVDRQRLGAVVFADRQALQALEAILHPLVHQRRAAKLAAWCRDGAWLAVLDIPLLFETGGERLCDRSILVTVPRPIQMARVLKRPGMTPERFRDIVAVQMPEAEKRRRADYVVRTGLSKGMTLRQLTRIVHDLRHIGGCSWPTRHLPLITQQET